MKVLNEVGKTCKTLNLPDEVSCYSSAHRIDENDTEANSKCGGTTEPFALLQKKASGCTGMGIMLHLKSRTSGFCF